MNELIFIEIFPLGVLRAAVLRTATFCLQASDIQFFRKFLRGRGGLFTKSPPHIVVVLVKKLTHFCVSFKFKYSRHSLR